MDWKKRITAEKNLFQVYLIARKVASSRANKILAYVVSAIIISIIISEYQFKYLFVRKLYLIDGIRRLADLGFVFTSSILGFLIAGFAIFASITKPEVFILLAKMDHKKGNISRLQFIFFNFLLVFIHFLLFLAICIFVKLALHSGGVLSGYFRKALAADQNLLFIGLALSYAALIGWLVYLLMLLKSFIWNLYQAVLVTIVTEAELAEQEVEPPK